MHLCQAGFLVLHLWQIGLPNSFVIQQLAEGMKAGQVGVAVQHIQCTSIATFMLTNFGLRGTRGEPFSSSAEGWCVGEQ